MYWIHLCKRCNGEQARRSFEQWAADLRAARDPRAQRVGEIAALFRDDAGDGFGVLAPQRLAGENHSAGIDGGRVDAGGVVGVVDDGAEPRLVDVRLAAVRRERDGRLEQGFARRHGAKISPPNPLLFTPA